jgi:hypothetical protein
MAKLLQTDQATYQLMIPAATRLEIAFYERRSRMAEDCYSPVFLKVGERVRIHAWFNGKNDAMHNPPLVLSVRCAQDGIHCSESIEMHISEERPVPFLLFIRAEVEPFEPVY